jgi:hypothetical protein
MSMANPSLAPEERFGFTVTLGRYSGASAMSTALMGVIGKDLFVPGSRVTAYGGLGVGFSNGRSGVTYGGRMGLQWSH